MYIKTAFFNEIAVDDRIEVGIVGHVVDVTVDVVIHPSGDDGVKHGEVRSFHGGSLASVVVKKNDLANGLAVCQSLKAFVDLIKGQGVAQ